MRILTIALGSQGDVQPYVALAKGLKVAGHSVRMMTHTNYERLVTSHGLEFYPVKGNVQEIVESPEMRELLEKGNFLAINAHTSKIAGDAAIDWAQAGLIACQGIDLIIAGIGGLFVAVSLAQKLQIPLLPAFLFPASPFWGPYQSPILHRYPTLYGFSPSVIAQPADWHRERIMGYWFLDAANDWTPGSDLLDFLQDGLPPVYIGFGSMGSRKQLTVEKLARAIERAVTDPVMRQRAADLGAKIQAEDGIGNVVSIVREIDNERSV